MKPRTAHLSMFCVALLALPACPKDPTTTTPPTTENATEAAVAVSAPQPDADWQDEYDSLVAGTRHCAPGRPEFPAGSGQCGTPASNSNPQSGVGQTGWKLERTPPEGSDFGQVFTQDCTGGVWSEQWISSNPARFKTTGDYPLRFHPIDDEPTRLTNEVIDAYCTSFPCTARYASLSFEYVALPSQSAINALPSSLPTDATWHATFLVKTDNGSSTVESGRLFRVITTSGGVETWHDHWVLFESYALVGASNSAILKHVGSTGADEHDPAYGPHDHLKDFMDEMRNDEAFDDETWDYVQIHYNWTTVPEEAPTGCPPS